jgi:hypothetical protein
VDDLIYTATVREAETSYPRGDRWALPAFLTVCALWIAWRFDFYWPIVAVQVMVVVGAWAKAWSSPSTRAAATGRSKQRRR